MSETSFPTEAVRRSKRRPLIVLSVFLVAVVAIVYVATRHNPGSAKVGECVRQTGADSVQVVGCADARAAFRVVGRVENKTEVEASLNACDRFADLGASQVDLVRPGRQERVRALPGQDQVTDGACRRCLTKVREWRRTWSSACAGSTGR